MLRAVINGKAGRPASVADGATWRQVFRASEDLLTATVFERLAYLDGRLLWEVLRGAFRPQLLPARRLVELREIEFWPTWQDTEGVIGQDVEPDVVLTLSVGDPPRTVVLIVECKLGGLQYPRQWMLEWTAFAGKIGADPPDEVWLLALGGLADSAARTVQTFTENIRATDGVELQALAADWDDLARALAELDVNDPISRRIVEDIEAALALNGYRNIQPLSGLATFAARYPIDPGSSSRLRLGMGPPRSESMKED